MMRGDRRTTHADGSYRNKSSGTHELGSVVSRQEATANVDMGSSPRATSGFNMARTDIDARVERVFFVTSVHV